MSAEELAQREENRKLQAKVASLERQLAQAHTIIEVQKTLADPRHPPGHAFGQRERLSAAVGELAADVGVVQACRCLGLARTACYRVKAPDASRVESVKTARHSSPRALSAAERQTVMDLLHSLRFVDSTPAQVVATLLDEGVYHCSTRIMYRLLGEHQQVKERRNLARRRVYARPDTIPDVFSRYVVAHRESTVCAQKLIDYTLRKQ